MSMNKKTAAEWAEFVTKALKNMVEVVDADDEFLRFEPDSLEGGAYRLTRPTVVTVPSRRLVVKFEMTRLPVNPTNFFLAVIVSFDQNLELVMGETTQVMRQTQNSTTPFFNAGLVPRAPAGSGVFLVNSLAIAAFGVGLFSAILATRREEDSDVGKRLMPYYANLIIQQIVMAIQVAANGGTDAEVSRPKEINEGVRSAIAGWAKAGNWLAKTDHERAKTGYAFDTVSANGEKVRMWFPTIATFSDTYALVFKFDHDVPKEDNHIILNMLLDRKRNAVLAVDGDVYIKYMSSRIDDWNIFSLHRPVDQEVETLRGPRMLNLWISQMLNLTVRSGIPSFHFAQEVGKLLREFSGQVLGVPRLANE